jgi:hypothetical protein
MLRQSIITYDGLPISSGGAHTLRTKSPLVTLEQVRAFIASCTNAELPKEIFVEVVSGDGIPGEFSAPLIEQLATELGVPKRRTLGANTGHTWSLAVQQVDAHVALIEHAKPLPVHPYKLQPIAVTVLFDFHLLAPQSRIVLPNQGAINYGNYSPSHAQLLGESHLYARISESSTVSLFLNFPFEEASGSLQQSVAFVQEHLPFSLSASHWKQWRLSKNGASYVGRKFNVPKAHI